MIKILFVCHGNKMCIRDRNGIVQGMRPLIGYNYGAGEHKRVSQIYQIVLCMSGIIMVL